MAPIWGIRPHVGVDAVVPAFLIIVLGGVGSLWGAVHRRASWSAWSSDCTGAYASEWSLLSMYLLVHRRRHVPRARLFGRKSVLTRDAGRRARMAETRSRSVDHIAGRPS